MNNFEDVITKMNGLVNEYHRMQNMDGNRLNYILKDMSACLYYLEGVRSDVHETFITKMNELIDAGDSATGAEKKAHAEFPAMYKLRRVMDGAYKVTEAIRSNISYLKHEMTNSQAA